MPFDGSRYRWTIEKPSTFTQQAEEEFLPYFFNESEELIFQRGNNIWVHGRLFSKEKNKNLIVISPGRGESSLKYCELVYELRGKGFDILIIDHRGQGFSSRLIANPLVGYIDSFNDYVDDFNFFLKKVTDKKEYNKRILLAHSMGTIIGLKGILRDQDFFQGAILSSPMLKINTRKFPELFSYVVLKVLGVLGFSQKRLYGKPGDSAMPFVENRVTSSRDRYFLARLFERYYPQTRMGPPSIQWLAEGIKASRDVYKRAKEIKIPMLMLQAGKDKLVMNARQDRFVRKATNTRIVKMPESKHEILQESDAIRNRALVQVNKFLQEI